MSEKVEKDMENSEQNTVTEGESKEPITQKSRKKRPLYFKIAVWVLAIGLFSLILGFGFDIYNDYSGFLKPYGKTSINIPAGSDTNAVVNILKKKGVVKYPAFYKIYIKANKKGGGFMRGIHTVTTDMGYAGITDMLSKEAENIIKVTIPEGFWQSQIVERFIEKGIGNRQSWEEALKKDYGFEFLKAADKSGNFLEGYLFPDTYFFYSDDTPEKVIEKMLNQFKSVIDKNRIMERAEYLGLTLDEAVRLSSVIQSEVPTMTEMKKVSAVFHNRLKINMKLQSCVTVLYAIGEHKSFVSIEDTKVESPYNTYYVEGLPKGPVCSPGKDALEASVSPDGEITVGGYLYFYSPNRKEVIYSKTYAEHQKAIAKNKGGTGTATAR